MTHTPGPWSFSARNKESQRCVVEAGEFAVAHAYDYAGSLDEEQAEANARLIAAAPDLLEALKLIRGWLLDSKVLELDGFWNENFVKANNATLAAIAKAEGQ